MLPDISKLSVNEIIQLYGNLIVELKQRGAIRSNNLIGDFGETIAIEFYNKTRGLPNLQVAPKGTQNVDALSRNGERYSIKATTGNLTGAFYGLPSKDSQDSISQKFEFVIIVRFNKDFSLRGIYELDWNSFLKHKKWHSRIKAWNLSLSKNLISSSKIIYQEEYSLK